MTSALLHGDDVLWDRLRVLLQERGIAPDDALLLDLFPDDTKLEFGLLITPDGRCISFDFDYLDREIADGVFSGWSDLTDRWQATPYADLFRVGTMMHRRRFE